MSPDPKRAVHALAWFMEFCAEHPEWTKEQFGEAGTAENAWFETTFELMRGCPYDWEEE